MYPHHASFDQIRRVAIASVITLSEPLHDCAPFRLRTILSQLEFDPARCHLQANRIQPFPRTPIQRIIHTQGTVAAFGLILVEQACLIRDLRSRITV